MPPHPLKNFEIRKYYQKEPKFNSIYSRPNLPKIKDAAFKNIPKEINKFIGSRNIIINFYRIQAYDSIICGYFIFDSFILC